MVGVRIRRMRKARRLTQRQLGDMAGVDRTCISRLERGQGNATLNTILLISECLRVPPANFFEGIWPLDASPLEWVDVI